MAESRKVAKYLYEYTNELNNGTISRRYFCKFTDEQGTIVKETLGASLLQSQRKLGKLLAERDAGKDFAEDRQKRVAAKKRQITLGDFVKIYFMEIAPVRAEVVENGEIKRPGKRAETFNNERRHWKQLDSFFADKKLSDISDADFSKFSATRSHCLASCAQELSFVRYLLGEAKLAKKLDVMPEVKVAKIQGARTKPITSDIFQNLVQGKDATGKFFVRKPYMRDYLSILHHTAMRPSDPLNLKWSMIDLDAGLIRLPAALTKEKELRRVPIVFELRQLLLRLRKETVVNLDGYCLTFKGKPFKSLRNAWGFAKARAGIDPRITPRSFRTGTITHWESLGIPRAACLIASGHKPSGVHEVNYVQLDDRQLVDCFARAGLMLPPQKRVPNQSEIVEGEVLSAVSA